MQIRHVLLKKGSLVFGWLLSGEDDFFCFAFVDFLGCFIYLFGIIYECICISEC